MSKRTKYRRHKEFSESHCNIIQTRDKHRNIFAYIINPEHDKHVCEDFQFCYRFNLTKNLKENNLVVYFLKLHTPFTQINTYTHDKFIKTEEF